MKAEERKKAKKLEAILLNLESAVIAYSGGADSSFLLKAAADSLGAGKIIAATGISRTLPAHEADLAAKLAESLGINTVLIKTDEIENEQYRLNPPDRCYFCKSELFRRLEDLRIKTGFRYVIDGSNYDDDSDYRPGARAAAEFKVRSPLKEAGLTKPEIRSLSKKAGLSTWDKPAAACLASRIPYGDRITEEKLFAVEKAEFFLKKNGIKNLRVRHHGNIARIETDEKEMPLLFRPALRKKTAMRFKQLGFKYVTVDIEGYRTGSLNEEINIDEKNIS